jgi:hypothetical protein
VRLPDGLGHLTYSTLVHPGDTWEELWQSLQAHLPRVKERVCPDAPFGVSLRLSAAAARTLATDPARRAELRAFLRANDLYVYTVNAFPYGPFKGRVVKEQVYEPDWRSEARTAYTIDVADVLADIAPASVEPSIQTPPLGFKPNITTAEDVRGFTEHLLQVVAHLVDLRRRTGRTVTLAIEPEPYCFLETTPEVIAFFHDELHSGTAALELARLADIPVSEAHAALHVHVGIVFDVCHQALEYEDVTSSLQNLVAAGIPILKLQEAAAIRVPEVDDERVEALRRFCDTIYLTQTLELRDGELKRYLNLEDAIAAWEADPGPREWRVHFHVPVFLEDLGPFRSTRQAIAEALAMHRETPLSGHLEIETYTWDVLPDELRSDDIVDYVAREIEWVRDQLLAIVPA